jgi:F-type H+-transporting ATPase subunit a
LFPLFPGGTNVTGNIAVTFTLAFISLLMIVFSGNKHYWGHIFSPPGIPLPVKIILVPIELIGIISKPFALMIRLFANIAGGHIVLLCIIGLIFILGPQIGTAGSLGVSVVTVLFTVFLYMIKLFVAALQAYIFTLLTALFIGQAVEEPAHH